MNCEIIFSVFSVFHLPAVTLQQVAQFNPAFFEVWVIGGTGDISYFTAP